LGFSPDRRTLAVVSIGSNSVTFIDTATNAVKHVTYVGRSPHEAFFTPDGKEVWVTVRGESHVAVLDGTTFEERARIAVPNGPGMQIFSPDGQYGYICSSFTPETVVVSVADHQIVGRVRQESPFCPNIAVTADGRQVWFTLKDIGKVSVFDGQPPFALLTTIDTGPISNHVNFAKTARGEFAYVTVGGLNQVQVFRTHDFAKVATIPVGTLPHGVWPSGDGSRVYVGLENEDELVAIDTLTQKMIASIPIGQAPQAVIYVPNAAPDGAGTKNLQPLDLAGQTTFLTLVPPGSPGSPGLNACPTSVSLFDQGLTQVLQASVTGLEPKRPYVLALSDTPDGKGTVEPLGRIHHKSRRRRHRERLGTDSSDRAGREQRAAPLSRNRARYCRRARRSGADPGAKVGMEFHQRHSDDRSPRIHRKRDSGSTLRPRTYRSVRVPPSPVEPAGHAESPRDDGNRSELIYSCRSAIIGSVREARRAGTRHASAAMTTRTSDTAAAVEK
jgi:YVTN family beta-propeller protein